MTTMAKRIVERMDAPDRNDEVWILRDLFDLGDWRAVYSALERLVDDGTVRRVGTGPEDAASRRGLFHKPRVNRLTRRESSPSPAAVVRALARRDNLVVLVDKGVAANLVGLTPLQPTRQVHHTSKNVPEVDLGGTTVTFRVAAPSKLFWAGRPGMMAYQAMTWARDVLTGGGDEGRDAALRVLTRHVSEHDDVREDLVANATMMPRWMQDVVKLIAVPVPEPGQPGMTF